MTAPANEPSMKLEWTYDTRTRTWVTGESENGCGVFIDEEGWCANVVFEGNITFLPAEDSKEEAMAEAEKEFARLSSLTPPAT
jgi:hypothetical protein